MDKDTFHDINLTDDVDNPFGLPGQDFTKQDKTNINSRITEHQSKLFPKIIYAPSLPPKKNISPKSNCCNPSGPNGKCSIQ
tara:strand:- start:304 stop:546 length:243 start_codon:yes stop_codon:yes gene_type:complete